MSAQSTTTNLNLRALVEKALPEDAPLHKILAAEGKLLAAKKPDMAVQRYRMAAESALQDTDSVDYVAAAEALNEAGTIRFKQGNFPEALQLFVEAAGEMDVLEKQDEVGLMTKLEDLTLSRRRFLAATIYENVAIASQKADKKDQAKEFFSRALGKFLVFPLHEDREEQGITGDLTEWRRGYVSVALKLASLDSGNAVDILRNSVAAAKQLVESKQLLEYQTLLHQAELTLATALADAGKDDEAIIIAEQVVGQIRTRGSKFTGMSKSQAQTILDKIRRKCKNASIAENNLRICASSGCDKDAPVLRCSQCKTVYYCSRECQLKDWKSSHKTECKKPQKTLQG